MSTAVPVIQQGYRFALQPSAEQVQFLAACAGASRFWFNQGLALVKDRLDRRGAGQDVEVPWSYKGLCVAFRGDAVKDELAPWRAEVVIGSYQAGRISDNRHVELDRRLGPIRSKESLRKLTRLLASDPHARSSARPCSAPAAAGSSASQCSAPPSGAPRASGTRSSGISRLATLSTGDAAQNSRPLQASLTTLRRLQRELDRRRRAKNPDNYLPDGRLKPGPRSWATSVRMVRTGQRIAKLHERVANLRREQAHQLTTALVREFGVIGVETLAVNNLMGNRRLARHIGDAGWGMVLVQLAYKTSWSDGSLLVAADRFHPSSKTCSSCRAVKAKLRLADRVFACDDDACGHVQDRDLNAALNLARMAHRHAQAGGSRRTWPVPDGSLQLRAEGRSASSTWTSTAR